MYITPLHRTMLLTCIEPIEPAIHSEFRTCTSGKYTKRRHSIHPPLPVAPRRPLPLPDASVLARMLVMSGAGKSPFQACFPGNAETCLPAPQISANEKPAPYHHPPVIPARKGLRLINEFAAPNQKNRDRTFIACDWGMCSGSCWSVVDVLRRGWR